MAKAQSSCMRSPLFIFVRPGWLNLNSSYITNVIFSESNNESGKKSF